MDPLASAAHRCLLISDIYQNITEEICLFKKQSKYALASLARSCTVLYEATIPVLWKYQKSLVPLLHLFPPGTWVEVPLPNGRDTVLVRSSPSQAFGC